MLKAGPAGLAQARRSFAGGRAYQGWRARPPSERCQRARVAPALGEPRTIGARRFEDLGAKLGGRGGERRRAGRPSLQRHRGWFGGRRLEGSKSAGQALEGSSSSRALATIGVVARAIASNAMVAYVGTRASPPRHPTYFELFSGRPPLIVAGKQWRLDARRGAARDLVQSNEERQDHHGKQHACSANGSAPSVTAALDTRPSLSMSTSRMTVASPAAPAGYGTFVLLCTAGGTIAGVPGGAFWASAGDDDARRSARMSAGDPPHLT